MLNRGLHVSVLVAFPLTVQKHARLSYLETLNCPLHVRFCVCAHYGLVACSGCISCFHPMKKYLCYSTGCVQAHRCNILKMFNSIGKVKVAAIHLPERQTGTIGAILHDKPNNICQDVSLKSGISGF